jgi:multisubunit Na+/H+ antiporter MnhC subunit
LLAITSEEIYGQEKPVIETGTTIVSIENDTVKIRLTHLGDTIERYKELYAWYCDSTIIFKDSTNIYCDSANMLLETNADLWQQVRKLKRANKELEEEVDRLEEYEIPYTTWFKVLIITSIVLTVSFVAFFLIRKRYRLNKKLKKYHFSLADYRKLKKKKIKIEEAAGIRKFFKENDKPYSVDQIIDTFGHEIAEKRKRQREREKKKKK